MNFVAPFQTTFILLASRSELYIKSYDRLKFFRHKFLKPKIYDKSIQCKNSTIKYILNKVTDKKILVKNRFITIFSEFYKIVNVLQRKVTKNLKPSIYDGERLIDKVYNILKNL